MDKLRLFKVVCSLQCTVAPLLVIVLFSVWFAGPQCKQESYVTTRIAHFSLGRKLVILMLSLSREIIVTCYCTLLLDGAQTLEQLFIFENIKGLRDVQLPDEDS